MTGGSNQLVSAAEAARYLDCSQITLLRNREEWGIPWVKVGNRVKFRVRDLDTFIKKSEGS